MDEPNPLSLPKQLALLAFCLTWMVLGLIGHDPWKPDEAYTFGLVYHIVHSGDWVVPTLAGEPFIEKPPLFFVTAALFAKALGRWMPLHDAARLAYGVLYRAFPRVPGPFGTGALMARISAGYPC